MPQAGALVVLNYCGKGLATILSAMMSVLIHWYDDGCEHDEEWPSVDAFLAWCASESLRPQWRAYSLDEDGEWVLFDTSPRS